MTRHFVEQLVRVNCPGSMDHNAETSITKLNVRGMSDGEIYIGHRVDTVCQGHCPPECKGHAYEPHELIPVYDGDQPASWDDCAWKPNKETLDD